MKIKFWILTLCMMTISTLYAQKNDLGGNAKMRIESQRIAFITQRLSLTPQEAEKFWPVYNAHRESLKALRDEFERPDLQNITDSDASHIIRAHLEQEQKRLDMKSQLIVKLQNVLPPRKIVMLYVAEKAFNREILRKAQEIHRQ